MPFLENVTRGRGIPRERLEEVGEHYFLFGGRVADQRPEPRVPGRAARGPRRRRDRPARLLGQPQLGPLPGRHAAADGGRRRHPGRLLRDQRLLVVLELPAVPREPRRRRRRASRSAPRLDKLRHYFNHPGFVEPVVDATLAALADLPGRGPRGRAPGLRHPLDPDGDERRPAAPTAAPTSPSTAASPRRSSTGCAQETGRRHRARAGLLLALRRRRRSRGWSRTSTTTSRRCARRGRAGRRDGPDRLRLRPHGGRLRPRHRGDGDRRAARPAGRAAPRPPGSTRGSSPWCATCCSSAPPSSAARSVVGRAVGQHGRACWDRCPAGLLPQPARRPPGARAGPARDGPSNPPELAALALDVAREAAALVRGRAAPAR